MRRPYPVRKRKPVNTAREYIETPYVECDHSYCSANAKFEVYVSPNFKITLCGHHKTKHEGHIIDSNYAVKQIGAKL